MHRGAAPPTRDEDRTRRVLDGSMDGATSIEPGNLQVRPLPAATEIARPCQGAAQAGASVAQRTAAELHCKPGQHVILPSWARLVLPGRAAHRFGVRAPSREGTTHTRR